MVALLAEGVDRNWSGCRRWTGLQRSPSSRRAWIEIDYDLTGTKPDVSSPSSRRAWIEMSSGRH